RPGQQADGQADQEGQAQPHQRGLDRGGDVRPVGGGAGQAGRGLGALQWGGKAAGGSGPAGEQVPEDERDQDRQKPVDQAPGAGWRRSEGGTGHGRISFPASGAAFSNMSYLFMYSTENSMSSLVSGFSA